MDRDNALRAWLLFDSGLPTLRSKELLRAWQASGIAVDQAMARLPAAAPQLGLSSSEARQLTEAYARHTPPTEPTVSAINWDAPYYPPGLETLPPKLQPALLFYRGDADLLSRVLIYLPPSELSDDDRESVREVVSLLLGEHLLLGVYQDSPQASIVLEELATAEGEMLLFARSGLGYDQVLPIVADDPLAARVLILSPLPPDVLPQPAWDAVLQQVALAAADRVVLTGRTLETTLEALDSRPRATMSLSAVPTGLTEHDKLPAHAVLASSPADVLTWVVDANLPMETASHSDSAPYASAAPHSVDAFGLETPDTAPPPSPEQIIDILKKGGTIPEALRRRLTRDP